MTPIFVVDSSVIVKWLNTQDEESVENADKILQDATDGKIKLISPELAKYEIGNVLLLKKKLPVAKIEFVMHALHNFPLAFISETEKLASSTYLIASDLGITYYDGSFLSLARHFKAVLVTENVKHLGKSHEVKVIPLSKYR